MGLVAAKCTSCGGQIEVDNTKEAVYCTHCGNAVITEKAINNYNTTNVYNKTTTINAENATSPVDNSDKLKKFLQNARRAKKDHNSEQAEKYYDLVLAEDPESWEAVFYNTYYKAEQCRIANISLAAESVTNCITTVLKYLKQANAANYADAIQEMSIDLIGLAFMLHSAAINHYDGINWQIKRQFLNECNGWAISSAIMLLSFGDGISIEFGENRFTLPIIIKCYGEGICLLV